MTLSLIELNGLPAGEAEGYFRACCGATRWVKAMVARRPFASVTAMLAAADEFWGRTTPPDWEEAFALHPRIGEPAAGASATANAWSAGEQSSAATNDVALRAAMSEANRRYEERFGRIYIVCATGRTAPELLADIRTRLANDPDHERAVAAEEQRKITRLRLEKLCPE